MSTVVTTDDVPPCDRVEYWRNVVWSTWRSVSAEPTARSFEGKMVLSSYGDIGVARVTAGAQTVTREKSDPERACLINMQLKGTGLITQSGRTAVLRPGDIALYDGTHPFELSAAGPNDQLVMQIPRRELVERNLHIDSTVARRAPGVGVAAVTATFARSLLDNSNHVEQSVRTDLGRRLVDCAVMALSCLPNSLGTAETLKSLQREQVMHYVAANASNPDLSVQSVAREFGVSTRTLQKLFAEDEDHLSVRIRRGRLAYARDALRDPLRAHQTISRISDDLGFSHPSHFAREFRAQFGCSPTEYRDG